MPAPAGHERSAESTIKQPARLLNLRIVLLLLAALACSPQSSDGDGQLLYIWMGGVDHADPVRPYSFAMRPEIDRIVVTSAPMMEYVFHDA